MPGTMQRSLDTVRFVARTYRTLHAMKTRRITPRKAGKDLARDATDMGPLYTKLAQFISARKDALDPDFVDALSVVQDSAPVPHGEPAPTLRGYDVDPQPIASASIADVYVGRARDTGRMVAIKRRRKGTKAAVETDLPLLSGVMRAASVLNVPGAANMLELINQSRDMVMSELDFTVEARAAEEFRRLFKDVTWLVVPRVLHATDDLLVSQFVASRKLSEVEGPNAPLARRLMNLYMTMLGAGYVHADPHPGNLGFRPDGTVVLYDFGAMLRVNGEVQQHVAKIITAGITKDAEGLMVSLEKMGVLTVDSGMQRKSVRKVLRRVLNAANVHDELRDAPEFTSNAGSRRVVTFGTTFIYLTRTLTLIQGACLTLDPEFEYDFARWMGTPDVMDGVMEVARDAAAIPATLRTMNSDLEDFQGRMLDELDAFKRPVVMLSLRAAPPRAFTVTSASNKREPVHTRLDKARKKLETKLKDLQAKRTVAEERRRKELWDISKRLDEIAREEVQRMDAKTDEDDDAPISVDFASSEDEFPADFAAEL